MSETRRVIRPGDRVRVGGEIVSVVSTAPAIERIQVEIDHGRLAWMPDRDAEWVSGPDDEEPSAMVPGMSLRDWFAGQALAGLLAADPEDGWRPDNVATHAYRMADAMLKERAR